MFLKLFKEGLLFAINSVVVNKLRTFLSLFGITIGIFCIISVFTVLDWLEKSIRDSIDSMGSNVLYVQKIPWSMDGSFDYFDIIRWPTISLNDYQAVRSGCEKAAAVSLVVGQGEKVKYGNNIANDVVIAAVTDDLEKVISLEIANGRYFSPFEFSGRSNVVVLGADIAETLFEDTDPVGKEVKIAGRKCIIIGVLKKEGEGAISLSNLDQLTIVPMNFGKGFINLRNRYSDNQMIIKAKPGISAQELSDEVIMILRASRRLKPAEENNFSINTPTMLSQGFDSVFTLINAGGWLIGGFAILVGGFGIANIMFVSVRERTNIIGIQKALGAKRGFILQQFLVESVLLSILGGILGILLIFIATLFINYLYDMNIHLTGGNITLALFVSGIIGIVAGYAPAYSAARMNPVDAIGYSF
ncbi:MAG TPA: ABC transporter permease [Bacteroidales bacterium]|nr:ABC transporter permease [Bacteroidales bacterium]HPI67783.1 ABC transporter permease [Bacteroidales bacterium]HPR72324.1 ABC transporter permease [Bacteroidales bacterium]